MGNCINITESGTTVEYFKYPNGELGRLRLDGECCSSWKQTGVYSCTLNAACIETFKELTFPIVKIEIVDKGCGLFKRWWWKGCRDNILFDVKITKVDEKKVTLIKTVSGITYMVDQTYDEVKAAVDGARNEGFGEEK